MACPLAQSLTWVAFLALRVHLAQVPLGLQDPGYYWVVVPSCLVHKSLGPLDPWLDLLVGSFEGSLDSSLEVLANLQTLRLHLALWGPYCLVSLVVLEAH